MSISSRREEEKQARIEAIKASAWKIFLRDGLEKAKIAEIAKDCRLGLSTLYYYFTDKRQIVYALMLDFKIANNRVLRELVSQKATYREFIQGYIDTHLKDLEHFRFFVLADSYYNYHNQYDLSDPILLQYDEITRRDGNYLIDCLAEPLAEADKPKMKVVISMILGFLRRYVLLPHSSWPSNEEQRQRMLSDLFELSCALFVQIGIDLESGTELLTQP